jgi:phosphohistidine phosphatase
MAVHLWLLRHGDAEPHGARPDEQRELTERGEWQSRAAGSALRALDVHFDAVLSSPRLRALDTARLACEALSDAPEPEMNEALLDATEPEVHEPLSAGFDGAGALRALRRWARDAHVLMVGHEPDLSGIVRDLTGAQVDLKKGGMAMIRLSSSQAAGGDLIVLLRPRELALIAETVSNKE